MSAQTGGSVIRPVSFCGTYGFKPMRGRIPCGGVFRTSVSLDQIGVFADTIRDVTVLSDVLACYDQTDLPFHDRPDADAAAGLEQVIEADCSDWL